jgi:hypothetical protein
LAKKRNGTETQSFGTSKREGHDSSKFYARKLYENGNGTNEEQYVEKPINLSNLDKV